LSTVLMLIALGVVSATAAEIRGQIVKKSGVRVPDGKVGIIRFLPTQNKYMITDGSVQLQISIAEIRELVIPKPAGLDAAIQQVASGAYSSAIPALQQIMEDYRMLTWDVPAARHMVGAYVNMGQPAKAVEMAEVAIKASPQAAYSGDLFEKYCDALLKAKRSDKLDRVLREAVENGSREVAAKAQIMRGNMQFEKGNFREALVDGYLRTIILFQDIRAVQPEALYKAIKAHEKVGEVSHAEKWRKKLLSEYPDSPYSRELRG
jgi:tetratricopeptide (TPR) repeat protein